MKGDIVKKILPVLDDLERKSRNKRRAFTFAFGILEKDPFFLQPYLCKVFSTFIFNINSRIIINFQLLKRI